MDKNLSNLIQAVDNLVNKKEELRKELLSSFSKELFGYPPSFKKEKPSRGKPPNLKLLSKIYHQFY
jgi:hypothetical protein